MGLLFCRAEFFFALFCQLAELAIAFACARCFQHAVIIVFRSAVAGHQRRSGNDGHKRKVKESIGVHHRSVRALSSGFGRYSANTNILGYFLIVTWLQSSFFAVRETLNKSTYGGQLVSLSDAVR